MRSRVPSRHHVARSAGRTNFLITTYHYFLLAINSISLSASTTSCILSLNTVKRNFTHFPSSFLFFFFYFVLVYPRRFHNLYGYPTKKKKTKTFLVINSGRKYISLGHIVVSFCMLRIYFIRVC